MTAVLSPEQRKKILCKTAAFIEANPTKMTRTVLFRDKRGREVFSKDPANDKRICTMCALGALAIEAKLVAPDEKDEGDYETYRHVSMGQVGHALGVDYFDVYDVNDNQGFLEAAKLLKKLA